MLDWFFNIFHCSKTSNNNNNNNNTERVYESKNIKEWKNVVTMMDNS